MPRPVSQGTPSLSPRYIRPRQSRVVLWSSFGALGFLIVFLIVYGIGIRTGNALTVVASPGTVDRFHNAIDTRCVQCHLPGKHASDLRCERCHDPMDTRRYEEPSHALVFARPDSHSKKAAPLSCGGCHDDHRGHARPLAQVEDRRCATCHDFASFNRHPEFAVARTKRGPEEGLEFSHSVHLREITKVGGERCTSCHVMTADQTGFEPIAFDAHCSRCHIKNGGLTLNTSEPLVTGLVPAELLLAASPPGGPALPRPPVSAQDGRGRVAFEGVAHRDPWILANIDRLSRAISTTSLSAERSRLESTQARLSAIVNATPLPLQGDRDLTVWRDSLRGQSPEQLRLLERIQTEVELRNDGNQAAPMVEANAERAAARRQLQQVAARLAALNQSPAAPGGADADSGRAKAALRGLVSACLACHRLTDDESGLRPPMLDGPVMPHANYSHKPHILQQGCETCHNTVQASKSSVDANVPGVATCQACHKPSQAKSTCSECHSYHPRSSADLIVAAVR